MCNVSVFSHLWLLFKFFVLLIFSNFIMMYLVMVSFELLLMELLSCLYLWVYIFHEIWVVFCCSFFKISPFLTSPSSSGTLLTHTLGHSLCPPRVTQAPFHYLPPLLHKAKIQIQNIFAVCTSLCIVFIAMFSNSLIFCQQHLAS